MIDPELTPTPKFLYVMDLARRRAEREGVAEWTCRHQEIFMEVVEQVHSLDCEVMGVDPEDYKGSYLRGDV